MNGVLVELSEGLPEVEVVRTLNSHHDKLEGLFNRLMLLEAKVNAQQEIINRLVSKEE